VPCRASIGISARHACRWRRVLIRPRIFLADDHPQLLEAEIALLSPSFDIVGTTSDGASLVTNALRLKPDVIVADITMPGMDGIDAVRELQKSGSSARLVFLTIHSEEEFVRACFAEGALGYVWKSRMKNHLIPAIYAALEGKPYISPLTVPGPLRTSPPSKGSY
jgi:DNA-binding NarL/FixJ family response regulator